MHNAKFIQVLLLRQGIDLQGAVGDTMLLAYVDDPAFNGDLLSNTIYKYSKKQVPLQRPDLQVLNLRALHNEIFEQINEGLQKLYFEVEMPLSSCLAHMEFSGIKVEGNVLKDLSRDLAEGILKNEEIIFKLAQQEFNISSPKQLGEVLFEDLGLRKIKKTKTGYSTGAEVLEELFFDHDIIKPIIDYRLLSKLKSTYVDALQKLIHPDSGRVHTIFKQAQTTTGRLSSIEPNLQNIPTRMEEGRKIRAAFVAGKPEMVLLSADYSQIDLRTLAHISQDQVLIETFKKGLDIHKRTAAEIFKVPADQVNSDFRRRAKAVNFGIIYGISDFKLAKDTGVSRFEAKKYIDDYLNTYPGVKKYMQDIVDFAMRHGYVETLLKRRRYLPDINSRNKNIQAFAKRMALNTPIQGTSADIIKLAMLDIDKKLQSEKLHTKMLLQIHDELVLEVTREEITVAAAILKEAMENAYSLAVPLKVNFKTGTDWGKMQELNI
jgi:DNA polymerase-1